MNIRSRSARAASGGLRFLLRALRPAPSRNATWLAAAALGLASLVGPSQADSAILVTNVPQEIGNNIQLRAYATNNDQGAIYNNAQWNIFKDLFPAIYSLDVNSDPSHPAWTGFSSLEDFIAGANIGISSSAPSNVFNGWNVVKNSDGSIETVNIGGIPNLSYSQWLDNVTAPNQSTQGIVYNVSLDKLAIGFDENNQATQWATIVLSSAEQPNMFIGNSQNMLDSWSADGLTYQLVIPEPKTYALLLGLIAGGAAILRRRRRSVVASR